MQKKVFLIYPPTQLFNREDRCQVPTKDVVIAPPLPPTDLMYLAAIAEESGCICRISDYTVDGRTEDEFKNDLREFKPDFLLISVTTPTFRQDLRSCSIAKEYCPDIITVAKGAHFLKFSTEALKDFPSLDIIIRGEPELTFKEIVEHPGLKTRAPSRAESTITHSSHGQKPGDFCEGLKNGASLENINGITWRSQKGIINNPDREFLDNLDILPLPARHLVDNARYVRPDNGRPQAVIKVARGCPYDCFFCLATAVSGSRVRTRGYENILAEIRTCIEQYKIKDFLFWSDIFNLDKSWVMGLCRSIIASGLRFKWATNTRADTIDLEMAAFMRKAGCSIVSIGIESGNEEIIEKIGKKVTLAKIRNSFSILKKARLKTFAYYIIGFPWDTRQTVEDTIRLAIELDSDFANFFTATAFPGTRFFDYALEQGLFGDENIEDSFKKAYYFPTVKGHYLTKDEIVQLHNEAVRRFYIRPRYIIKQLLNIRSPVELFNYLKAGFTLVRKKNNG